MEVAFGRGWDMNFKELMAQPGGHNAGGSH